MSETLKFNDESVKENWATNAFKAELKDLQEGMDKDKKIKDKIYDIKIDVVNDFLKENKNKARSYRINSEGNNEGRSGKIVTATQIALKDFGFDPGTIDGKFGPKTKGALDEFKKSTRVIEENIGSKTIQKLIENIGATKEKRIIWSGETPRLGKDKRNTTGKEKTGTENGIIEKKTEVTKPIEEDLTKKETQKQNEFFNVIVDSIEKNGLLNNEIKLKDGEAKLYGEKDTVLSHFKDKKIVINRDYYSNPNLCITIRNKNNQIESNISFDSKICMKDGKFNQEVLLRIVYQKLEKKMSLDIQTQKTLEENKRQLETYEKQNKVISNIQKMSKKYTIDNLGFSAEEKESLILQRIFRDFENGKIEFNSITKDNLIYGKESKKINIKIDINNSLNYYPMTRKFEDICDNNIFNEKKFQEKLKKNIKGLAEANYKV